MEMMSLEWILMNGQVVVNDEQEDNLSEEKIIKNLYNFGKPMER